MDTSLMSFLDARKVFAAAVVSITVGALAPGAVQAAGAPDIGAAWSTEVTATSARLHAEINPNGSAVSYHFDYLTEAAYQANLKAAKEGFAGALKAPPGINPGLGAGSSFVLVQQSIGALAPETTYRYRVLAGTEIGADHTFTTEPVGGGPLLLDNRGWEMVSPVDKNGGEIRGFGQNYGGDVLQAAAAGGLATYSSIASFGNGAQGAPPASQYIARRGLAGWSTENITTPLLSGSYGDHPNGVPYQLFSGDLSRGLLLNGVRCRDEGTGCPVANQPLPGSGSPPGYQNYYLRDDENGSFAALLTNANSGELILGPADFELNLAAATPDLSHIVLSTCAALTPEATEVAGVGGSCDPAEPNLYLWSGSAFALINVLPDEIEGTPGAAIAAQSLAVSSDGSRVYFTQGGDLYLGEGNHTVQVDAAPEVGGGGGFQTASADGSVAFFSKAGKLYRYEAAVEATTDLTPAGELQGVLGASADGSYLYYATAAGLFLSHEGAAPIKVATAATESDYPPTTGTARVSPDGIHLAFLSRASLTGYDNTDQLTGQPDTEVYLYSAAPGGGSGTLTCASCRPTNERPTGPSTIPGASANGSAEGATHIYKPRDLSADGSRLFFDSADALVPMDTDAAPDVYEWEAQGAGSCQRAGGCIALVSSGRGSKGASFVDASADGTDALFLTEDSLVPSDPGSVDLYDAREGGGFPQPSPPLACEGDACQSLPPEPEDPVPGTLQTVPGNPPLHFNKRRSHKKRHHHRTRKHHRSQRRVLGNLGGQR